MDVGETTVRREERESIRDIVERAERVGAIFARYYYGIDNIPITLERGKELPYGAYVFVKDRDGLPIVYQIARPIWFRPSEDFEEGLIASGECPRSGGLERYRCSGVLFGKILENGDITQPKYPPSPFTPVYKCPEELVKLIVEPLDEWKIRIGVDVETGTPITLALTPLLRQSLLIAGAQGTGKTTGMLTLISRSACKGVRFLILDWTGEYIALKSGEYEDESCKHLKDKTIVVPWWKFAYAYIKENPIGLVDVLREEHPWAQQKPVSGLLTDALAECTKDNIFPTKEKLLEEIEKVKGNRWPETVEKAKQVIMRSSSIVEKEPEKNDIVKIDRIVDYVKKYRIVVVDFTETKEGVSEEFEFKKKVAEYIVERVWKEATLYSKGEFGCVVVSDEAHRICPEPRVLGGSRPSRIWISLATEGGRNNIPFWLVARRLSLVAKSITVESQQNFICFNVEDVDRRRVLEDLGETFASLLGSLPRGEALVKSMGFRKPGSVSHVKFDVVVKPLSARVEAKGVFDKMLEKEEPSSN